MLLHHWVCCIALSQTILCCQKITTSHALHKVVGPPCWEYQRFVFQYVVATSELKWLDTIITTTVVVAIIIPLPPVCFRESKHKKNSRTKPSYVVYFRLWKMVLAINTFFHTSYSKFESNSIFLLLLNHFTDFNNFF